MIEIEERGSVRRHPLAETATAIAVDDDRKPEHDGDEDNVGRLQVHEFRGFQYDGSTRARQVLRCSVRIGTCEPQRER